MGLQAHFDAEFLRDARVEGVSGAIRIARGNGMTECIVVFLPAEALVQGDPDDGRRARGAGLPEPALASLASVLRDLVGRGPADADRSTPAGAGRCSPISSRIWPTRSRWPTWRASPA